MHGLRKDPFKARWRNANPPKTRTRKRPFADEISAGRRRRRDDVVDKILKEWMGALEREKMQRRERGAPTGVQNCKCVFLIKP